MSDLTAKTTSKLAAMEHELYKRIDALDDGDELSPNAQRLIAQLRTEQRKVCDEMMTRND